ncbi:MAG: hypothetical protein GXO26_08480 [Crenarchaeota archaeon]|nr:hypothetical protein [Thermoproteota archaeon]
MMIVPFMIFIMTFIGMIMLLFSPLPRIGRACLWIGIWLIASALVIATIWWFIGNQA